jgi:phospholipid/cholesterol/gamma-HCH transport system permease protein
MSRQAKLPPPRRLARGRRLGFWELNFRLVACLLLFSPLRRARALLWHLDGMGVRTVPLTVVISGLLGFTGVYVSRGKFQLLYQPALPALLGRLFVEQIAPLVTTFLVVGRSIVSMTAELASMRSAREIDSLEIIGQDPVEFLLLPRLLALLLALPALTVFALFAAMTGGWLAEWHQLGRMQFARFAREFFGVSSPRLLGIAVAVKPWMLTMALAKAAVCAWAVVVIGGYFGLSARGDEEESVGRAVRQSVAWCLVGVTVINLLFAVAHGG